MNHKIIDSTVLLILLIFTACAAFAQDNDTQLGIAKKHCGRMVPAGKEAVNRGGQKNTKDAVVSLKKMLEELSQGYCWVERVMLPPGDAALEARGKETMARLSQAAEKVYSAIHHGEAGRHEEMMKEAQVGVREAEEICSLVNAMK